MDQPTVLNDLTNILADLTADWETSLDAPIGPQTRLIGDLSFESIDVVHLITAIEEHYGRRDLPFEEVMMQDGKYVDEVTVGQLSEFLASHLSA